MLLKQAPELQHTFKVLPWSRSIKPKSLRSCGDSGRARAASAQLFWLLYLIPLLTFPLKETRRMRRTSLRNLFNSHRLLASFFVHTWVMLLHYNPCADDCQAFGSCFCGLCVGCLLIISTLNNLNRLFLKRDIHHWDKLIDAPLKWVLRFLFGGVNLLLADAPRSFVLEFRNVFNASSWNSV